MIRRLAVQLRGVKMKGRTLHGHASVFGQFAEVDGSTVEEMDPAAFDVVLADPATDARALWNHESRLLLGRQGAGTLRLDVDGDGLPYEVDLPDTSYADDLAVLVKRGDLDGASFGFIPGTMRRGRTADGRTLITHTSVAALIDVSPVTFPAYAGASTALRHLTFGAGTRRIRTQAAIIRHRVREAHP